MISYSPADGLPDFTFKSTIINTSLSFGINGYFNITWNSVDTNLKVAILIEGDTNIQLQETYKYVKNYSDEYTVPLVTIQLIGPITMSLYAGIKLEMPLEVIVNTQGSILNERYAFTGLYGGYGEWGAKWGVTWKKWWIFWYPSFYSSGYSNFYKIAQSTYYAGVNDSNGFNTFNNASISIIPKVSINAGIGINTKLAYAQIGCSESLKNQLTISRTTNNTLTGSFEIDALTGMNAEVGLNIPGIPSFLNYKKVYPLNNETYQIAHWVLF